jgi:hypothetical protein
MEIGYIQGHKISITIIIRVFKLKYNVTEIHLLDRLVIIKVLFQIINFFNSFKVLTVLSIKIYFGKKTTATLRETIMV